jgi:hypothetical protein
MVNGMQDIDGCSDLDQLFLTNDLKLKLLQKERGGEWLFFVEILSGRGDPCSVLHPQPTQPKPKCTLIRKGVQDDDDGKVWDWYYMRCPTGPPCLFMQNL